MVYICNICKLNFNSSSFEDLSFYCKHVGSCPMRSYNFLAERFKCNRCSSTLRNTWNYKNHLLKCQPPKLDTNSSTLKQQKELRERGKYSSYTFIFGNLTISSFPGFDAQRCKSGQVSSNQQFTLNNNSSSLTSSKEIPFTSYFSSDSTATHKTTPTSKPTFSTDILKVVARLFSRTNVSMDGAEGVMEDLGEIAQSICEIFQKDMQSVGLHFTKENQEILKERVDHTSQKIISSLEALNTEQKLKTALSRKNVFDSPKRVTFNEKIIQVEDSLKTIKSEAILLPIEQQLKSFLERPGVLKSMLDYHTIMEEQSQDTIKHFLNGKIWKTVKSKFHGTVIPIFLYNDDFAPDDTRSPHGSSNKISAFYCSFPSLPPNYNSTLESILVLMLAKSEEIKEVGANELLRILVQDLKPYEDNGIELNGQRVFIAPVLLMGDNLGINMNLGFPMNFSKAIYYCRFCFMKIAQCNTACKEIETFLRTEDIHKECLNNLGNPNKNLGVMSRCDLEILKSFSVTQNFSVDIMHDLLSGIYVYGITQLIKKGIADKLFTLRDFNTAKNEFDYGYKEAHYVVENITSPKSEEYTISCHAREMWCLIKFLPFILQKILPENHCLFKYGLILVDLLDICFKNCFSNADLGKLGEIVTLHNKEFLRLFNHPERPRLLTAKFHFLLHYVRVVQHSGPLKHLWSMRFEAKHQHLKSQAKIMYSRRNICYSFAKKICFQIASNYLNESNFLKKVKSCSKNRHRFMKCYEKFLSTLDSCSKVNIYGTAYYIGDYIISDEENFAYKILQIAVDVEQDIAMFVVEKFALRYIKPLRSFKLCDTSKEIECYDSSHFTNPPINSHLFESNYYLRKDEF